MRKASQSPVLKTVPVFAASATENIGTIPLLEALVAYTTAPAERSVNIQRGDEADTLAAPQTDSDPLVAYVFKTLNDRFVGTLNYFRIFAGSISSDGRNINARSGVDGTLQRALYHARQGAVPRQSPACRRHRRG